MTLVDFLVLVAAWIAYLFVPAMRTRRPVVLLVVLTIAFGLAGYFADPFSSIARIALIGIYLVVWAMALRWAGSDDAEVDTKLRSATSDVSLARDRWASASVTGDAEEIESARVTVARKCAEHIAVLRGLQPSSEAWQDAVKTMRVYLEELRSYTDRDEGEAGRTTDPAAADYLTALNQRAYDAWSRALHGRK